jgi:RimJ/RimL family protein N-acetyltransferase
MIPVLTTQRLTLRAPRLADFEPYAAVLASERARHIHGPHDRAFAWKEFVSFSGQWLLMGFGGWSIEERASGRYCGEVSIIHPAHYAEPEMGWTLVPEAEGRGIAFEAARAARSWAYRSLGLATLVSYVMAGNERSIRLAERLGARLDPAAPRPATFPCLVYRHPGPEAL